MGISAVIAGGSLGGLSATNAMALANSITSSSNVNVVEALKRWEPSQLELKLS